MSTHTVKIYPGFPHGLMTVHADVINTDLLNFIRAYPHDAAVLGPMIEREILWRLLQGEQGAMTRQIGLTDSRLSRISQTIRWIRAHPAQPLHIEELARMATMSESSFHRHFRAVTAMSPLQYQKQIRLQQARTLLLTASEDIAAVGYSVGYDSPSQFSREYSRLFGEPPSRDLNRLRKGALPDVGFA